MILPGPDGYFRPKNIEQLDELLNQKISYNKIIFMGSLNKEIIIRLKNIEDRVETLEYRKNLKKGL
jgi:hypothetical protein